eukprot:12614581-Alexandrium_andersonii.AAC.1
MNVLEILMKRLVLKHRTCATSQWQCTKCMLPFPSFPTKSLEPPWRRSSQVKSSSKMSLGTKCLQHAAMLKCEHTWCVCHGNEVATAKCCARARSGVKVLFNTPPHLKAIYSSCIVCSSCEVLQSSYPL